MIIIVGMGNKPGDITAAAKKAINEAEIIAVRTLKIPVLARLKKRGAVSMDFLYERAGDFSELDSLIATELIRLEEGGKNVAYCVDGDGFSDSSVAVLSKTHKINIIQGVTDFGARYVNIGGILNIDAYSLISGKPVIDTGAALTVTGIDNALLAGEVKLYLLDFYPPEQKIFINAKGGAAETELAELDRQNKYDSRCSVYIAGQDGFNKDRYCYADLLRIMSRLTGENGCEWDKAQTHESIRINMIEEAYEAVDAIDSGDIGAMVEETGDVILQSVLHADIAARCGEYNINDVIDALSKKLVTRHTHIFGDNKASDAAEALSFWEKAKAEEKKQSSLTDKLDAIPAVFPAVLKTEKAVKKTQKEGLILSADKIKEAISAAVQNGETDKALFLCVALSALSKKNAEIELNTLCNEFIKSCKDGGVKNKDITELL